MLSTNFFCFVCFFDFIFFFLLLWWKKQANWVRVVHIIRNFCRVDLVVYTSMHMYLSKINDIYVRMHFANVKSFTQFRECLSYKLHSNIIMEARERRVHRWTVFNRTLRLTWIGVYWCYLACIWSYYGLLWS